DVVVDWPPPRRPRRRLGLLILALLAAIVLGGGTAVSYYVEALWFDSLGYAAVFWRTLNFQSVIFVAFAVTTFFALLGGFLALKPERLGEFSSLIINGQPFKLPVEPVLKLIALGLSLAIAAATGAGMMAEWSTLALYWYAPTTAGTADPVLGRPISFYLFALPVWQLISGWILTLAVILCAVAAFFLFVSGGTGVLPRQRGFYSLCAHWREMA